MQTDRSVTIVIIIQYYNASVKQKTHEISFFWKYSRDISLLLSLLSAHATVVSAICVHIILYYADMLVYS